jgi:4-aminobutyrate aminotransferase-like enzyme
MVDFKSITAKINKVKKQVTGVKAKVTKASTKAKAKAEIKKADSLKDRIANADKRLKELHSESAIAKKEQEIAELERKLSKSGKALDFLSKVGSQAVETAKKGAKEYQKSQKKGGRKKKKTNFWDE